MNSLRISLALLMFLLFASFMQPVRAADKDQMLLLQKSFPTESGERLKVNAYSGDVKIDCWHNNEIVIKIYGSSDAVKYLNFDVSSDEMGINIAAVKKAGIDKVKNFNLRYEICVPHDYCVKVTGGKGNVNVENPRVPVEISKSK